MALFNGGEPVGYPAYLVSINLGGADVGFWLAAVPGSQDGFSSSGSPALTTYDPAAGEGTNALLGATISDYADVVPSLLSAVKTWAEGVNWGPGLATTHGVKITCVTGEQTTDVTPS
jgi:hypothetical protein